MKRGRRFLCGILFSPCLLATGCLIPYAYPKLDYVPGTDLGTKATDVHAFRVDVTARQVDIGESGSIRLTEIQPRADGSFPAQTKLSIEHGVYIVGGALNFNVGQMHTTRVRLYRPGYHLVEMPAWGSANDAVWTPAPDWQAQEKAIDDLLQRPAVSASAAHFVKSQGSFWDAENQPRQPPELTGSPATSRVFAFAAAEYERVAKLASTPENTACLREKAKWLIEAKPTTTPVVEARLPASSP